MRAICKRCCTCKWCEEITDKDNWKKLICRRYPPTVTGQYCSQYPCVTTNSWCGEWESETKNYD